MALDSQVHDADASDVSLVRYACNVHLSIVCVSPRLISSYPESHVALPVHLEGIARYVLLSRFRLENIFSWTSQ